VGCGSDGIIKPLSKQITRDYKVFIPVSNGKESIRIDQETQELQSEIIKLHFCGPHRVQLLNWLRKNILNNFSTMY